MSETETTEVSQLMGENMKFVIDYKPLDTDRFLVAYPKTGSHWTYFIVRLIVNDGVYDQGRTYRCYPTRIEFFGKNTVFKPVITTHLGYDLLPKNPMAQYLLVFRNPKDTVVSHYYFSKQFKYIEESTDFHQFFRQWIAGEWIADQWRTDYFTHVSQYWTHILDTNFHYVIYEQMKRNPKEGVLKIANFLGKEFVDKLLANNELLLNEVLNKSSFDSMKSITNDKKKDNILRKGIVGGWRSQLSRDESDLIDEKFKEYFAGTELESIWREDMKWL